MPAYYWVQLYKEVPNKNQFSQLVESTIDAIIKSGGKYKHVINWTVKDDSLPRDNQSYQLSTKNTFINNAINSVTDDLKNYQSIDANVTLRPKHQIVFNIEFIFDQDLYAEMSDDIKFMAREFKLNFDLEEDHNYGFRVTIELYFLQEFVLMYGNNETHFVNKKIIFEIVENICCHIHPFWGWMDEEMNSIDDSYELIGTDKLPLKNEFIIIGPQLLEKVSHLKPDETEYFYKKLNNNSLMLHLPWWLA